MNDLSHRADAALQTEFGWISVELEGSALRRLRFDEREPEVSEDGDDMARQAGIEAVRQFLGNGGRVEKAPPLKLAGTPFQQKVWTALRQIPPGITRTYGELARQLGTAPRAIGSACRSNPILLFVPCHRVVAATGAGGFAGETAGRWMEIKRWLLAREGVHLG
jgi:methylated-DNA-[protein]-cysteine S-methyltransferase